MDEHGSKIPGVECHAGIKITEIGQSSNHRAWPVCVCVFCFFLTFVVIHKSCHPSFRLIPHCAVIDWGRQPVIHEHHRGSIRFSLSAFNGRLFYSLIKWDSTPPPHSHLSLSLHDNQLMHVQTPPGSATYNIPAHTKKRGRGGRSAKC